MTTKNGTRMVLSVSKTFMKLKDLILEKKSLEDKVEKMKAINNQLVSKSHLGNTFCEWIALANYDGKNDFRFVSRF